MFTVGRLNSGLYGEGSVFMVGGLNLVFTVGRMNSDLCITGKVSVHGWKNEF